MTMATKSTVVLSIVAIFSLCVLAVGLALTYVVFPKLIKDKVKELLPLRNGSESFTKWKDPPATVYMQFYMFNVKNAHEIVADGEKPIVEQLGPYTYRETRPKKKIKFSANGTLVSYHSPKYYTFVPELSSGQENDSITVLNLAYATFSSLTQSMPDWFKKKFSTVLQLTGDGLFAKHTVKEMLWGYKDPLISKVKELVWTVFHQNLTILDDTVGLFYKPNGNQTDDGLYTIYTGVDNLEHFGQIATWNGNNSLPYWKSSTCNMINGSDGSVYPPFMKKTDTLYLFSTDICRSVYARFEQETEVKEIPLWRFIPPRSVFENHTANPANEGFCVPDCGGTGVLQISSCKKGVPIVVSQPHFYEAYPGYINAIEGMSPRKEWHETYVDVEPNTGTGMRLAKKLQINMQIKPDKDFEDLKNIKEMIFPLAWLNESAVIGDSAADSFRSEVIGQIRLTWAVQYGLIGLGVFILVCVLVITISTALRNKRNKGLQVQVSGSREGLLAGDT